MNKISYNTIIFALITAIAVVITGFGFISLIDKEEKKIFGLENEIQTLDSKIHDIKTIVDLIPPPTNMLIFHAMDDSGEVKVIQCLQNNTWHTLYLPTTLSSGTMCSVGSP